MFRREPEETNFLKNRHFAVGAILGGLVGSVGAFLLAPKGHDLMEDLQDKYEDVSERIGLRNKRNKKTPTAIIGSVAGGLLGIAAALWLANQDKRQLKRNLSKAYSQIKKHASQYVEEGQDILGRASQYGEEVASQFTRGRAHKSNSRTSPQHRHPIRLKRK